MAVVQDAALEVLGELTLKPNPFDKGAWSPSFSDPAQWEAPQVTRCLTRVGERPPRAPLRVWSRGTETTLSLPQTTERAAPALEPPTSWKLPRRTP